MFGNASAWGAPAAVPVAAAVPAPPANPTIKKFKELRRFYSHDKAAPGAAAPVAPSLYGAAAAPAAPAARIINPDCKFIEIHYDSNEGDPTAPVKPSFVEQAAWDAALQDNPDTVKMNPQAVVGIKNLKSRADIIKEQRLAYQDTVGRVSSGLEAVKRKIQKNKLRFKSLGTKQTNLRMRFMAVMKNIEVLRTRSTRLHPGEETLREKMQSLDHLLKAHKAQLDALVLAQRDQVTSGSIHQAPTTDAHLLDSITKAHTGLVKLRDILDKDRRDMDIIRKMGGM